MRALQARRTSWTGTYPVRTVAPGGTARPRSSAISRGNGQVLANHTLQPSHLGVALDGCSNNSARTFFSVSLGCIRLARGGVKAVPVGLGTAAPLLAQPDIASAQVSDSAVSDGLCILPLLLVFGGQLVHALGSHLLGLPAALAGPQRVLGGAQFPLHQLEARLGVQRAAPVRKG